jgi:hypothetical protein
VHPITLTAEEITYILKTLAKQQYALERYTEMKGAEDRVMQELALLRGIVKKLCQTTQPD